MQNKRYHTVLIGHLTSTEGSLNMERYGQDDEHVVEPRQQVGRHQRVHADAGASAQASDFSGTAAKLLGVGGSLARTVGSKAMGVAGFAVSPLTNQFKKLTNAYRGLGTGPLTKAGKDKQLMAQAKQRLAADQAYEKLKGESGGGTSLPEKAASASAVDAARRQEAMKNAKSPQMRQRELDSYITNQFLRNRWTERDE